MTLTYAGLLDRGAVTHAARLVHRLVARPEVAAAWTRESSCAGMSVGGLTRHLVAQSDHLVRALDADPADSADAEVVGLVEHYQRESWIGTDLDTDLNRLVRERYDAQAEDGPDAAVELQQRALERLPALLADAPETVVVPWQGWRMATDDLAVTRLMEMVVHSDDLAASVDVPVPDFGPAVLRPVLGLLTELALVRHGQDAVVRALTRPQRAPVSIAAL